jgi:hypothetical protein
MYCKVGSGIRDEKCKDPGSAIKHPGSATLPQRTHYNLLVPTIQNLIKKGEPADLHVIILEDRAKKRSIINSNVYGLYHGEACGTIPTN